MPEQAPDDGGTHDLSPAAHRWLLALAALGGLWLTHRGLLARTPAGTDVMAHVSRTDAALHLFRHGRTDGWYPTFGSGYRLFAVYGPGLALASGVVRVLSLGLLHPARSFALLGSVSVALLPPTMAALARELGTTRRASVIAGVLTLFVGSTVGGGLAGLYAVGLVPQAVAMPAQLLVLTGVLRIVRTGSMRVVAATAVGVGWLLILHPISLLVAVAMAPGLLLAVPRPWPVRNLLRAAGAGLWGAALVAWWLLPAIRDRALRGNLSAFDTPSLPERLGDVLAGDILYPTVLAVAVGLGLAVALGQATRPGAPRRWLAAPLTAVAYLAIGHVAVGQGWGPDELWVQLPNRGLVLAGCLLLLPLSVVAADALGSLREPVALRATAGLVAALVVAAPLVLGGTPLGPRQSAPAPSPDLQAIARYVKHHVPLSSRHLVVQPSPFVALGTSEPTRWLASASGRNTAQLYFAEATRNPGAGLLPDSVLAERSPADALGPMRRAGITHLVVTTPDPARQLDGQPGYRLLEVDGPLAIYAIEADRGAPPVAAMLQPDEHALRADTTELAARLRRGDAEHLSWTTDADLALPVVAPVAHDPAWQATVDGHRVRVTRTSEGLVGFTVPQGQHRVELRFTGSRNHWPGLVIGGLALAVAAWVLVPGGVSALRQRFQAHQAKR